MSQSALDQLASLWASIRRGQPIAVEAISNGSMPLREESTDAKKVGELKKKIVGLGMEAQHNKEKCLSARKAAQVLTVQLQMSNETGRLLREQLAAVQVEVQEAREQLLMEKVNRVSAEEKELELVRQLIEIQQAKASQKEIEEFKASPEFEQLLLEEFISGYECCKVAIQNRYPELDLIFLIDTSAATPNDKEVIQPDHPL